MRIDLTDIAQVELLEVWNYNAERYGLSHADEYHQFLVREIAALATQPDLGTVVQNFPNRRGLTIRRQTRGHGHIAIYRLDENVIRVLHVFHTAQDVSGRIERE